MATEIVAKVGKKLTDEQKKGAGAKEGEETDANPRESRC